MKKILLLMFSVLCINSFSYVERNDQVGNRGLELIRESNINENMGLSKESGSTQIIDVYAGNGKFAKTKEMCIRDRCIGCRNRKTRFTSMCRCYYVT